MKRAKNKKHISYCVIFEQNDVYIERRSSETKVRTNMLGKFATLEEALNCVARWYENNNYYNSN